MQSNFNKLESLWVLVPYKLEKILFNTAWSNHKNIQYMHNYVIAHDDVICCKTMYMYVYAWSAVLLYTSQHSRNGAMRSNTCSMSKFGIRWMQFYQPWRVPPCSGEAITLLQEGEKLISLCQKSILIVDRSEYGWVTVAEYEKNELADNSDDKKWLFRA